MHTNTCPHEHVNTSFPVVDSFLPPCAWVLRRKFRLSGLIISSAFTCWAIMLAHLLPNSLGILKRQEHSLSLHGFVLFCLHSMHKRRSALQVHKDSRSHPTIQTHCIGTPPCYTPARYAPFSDEKTSGSQGKVMVGCNWLHLVSSDWHINPGPKKVPRKYHW